MIYFDNAATTRVLPEAAEAVREAMTDAFGNPSSPYRLGLEAERLLRQAREAVAGLWGAVPMRCILRRAARKQTTWPSEGLL